MQSSRGIPIPGESQFLIGNDQLAAGFFENCLVRGAIELLLRRSLNLRIGQIQNLFKSPFDDTFLPPGFLQLVLERRYMDTVIDAVIDQQEYISGHDCPPEQRLWNSPPYPVFRLSP